MHVRHANLADAPAMIGLDRQSQSAAHWSLPQYEALFVTAGSHAVSQRFVWVVEDDSQVQPERVPNKTSEIVAFLIAHRIDAEWELENIVVAELARRQGLATLLVREFIAHAQRQNSTGIFLEVRESNLRARSLYGKLGFQEAGLRKGYYSDPAEDAIVCRLRLY